MVLVLISGLPLAKARPLRIHDYVFNVLGLVAAEGGDPIEGAEVTLEVTGPVYDVITTVKTAKRLTDSGGSFIFMYISHKRAVPYTLTVRKDGFEPQTVSGKGPPDANDVIRLKRTGRSGATRHHE